MPDATTMCRSCEYPLLPGATRCPECGAAYDPAQGRWFTRHQRIMIRAAVVALLIFCGCSVAAPWVVAAMGGSGVSRSLLAGAMVSVVPAIGAWVAFGRAAIERPRRVVAWLALGIVAPGLVLLAAPGPPVLSSAAAWVLVPIQIAWTLWLLGHLFRAVGEGAQLDGVGRAYRFLGWCTCTFGVVPGLLLLGGGMNGDVDGALALLLLTTPLIFIGLMVAAMGLIQVEVGLRMMARGGPTQRPGRVARDVDGTPRAHDVAIH